MLAELKEETKKFPKDLEDKIEKAITEHEKRYHK